MKKIFLVTGILFMLILVSGQGCQVDEKLAKDQRICQNVNEFLLLQKG